MFLLNKIPLGLNSNQATIQLQLSFLIATRSINVADSWAKLQCRWERQDKDRTTNALRGGLFVLRVPGGKTVDICDNKVIEYRERHVWKSMNRDKKGRCSLPFYQLSVAKLSLNDSLEIRVLKRQISTMVLAWVNPGHSTKSWVYVHGTFKPLNNECLNV